MSRGRRTALSFSFSRAHVLLLAVLLLGAFLRFYRLDAQSFWNDEGNAARMAERSLDLIVEGAAGDIHPPGYYLLLHYWRAGFGESEFALRSLSAVAGLALIVLTHLLGRRLLDESTGLIAAFLAALSPFAVYYSQEARMYALLGFLSALATFFAFRSLPLTSSRWTSRSMKPALLIGYVLANAAGLYTHYAFVFVVVAHNVVFGAWWLVRLRRGGPSWWSLAAWAGAQTAVLVCYLPWLPRALAAAGWRSVGGGYHLGSAFLDVLRVLTVGVTLPLNQAAVPFMVTGGLLLLGVGSWRTRDRPRQRLGLSDQAATAGVLAYLLIPLALFFALDLYKPAWLKFLIVTLLPFHILVARGVRRLGDLLASCLRALVRPSHPGSVGFRPAARALVALAVAALVYPSLRNLYFNPAYYRDDYRQIAADIEDMRRDGDAVILNAPNQWEVFTYYYPDRHVYPAPYRPSSDEVKRFVIPILREYERLFVLYWGHAEADPARYVESSLADHAYKSGERWYGDVRLATYGVAPLPGRPQTALDVWFGGSVADSPAGGDALILLQGYAVAQVVPFEPGDVVPVTLFWEAGTAIEDPYKVTLQILDNEGSLSAQVDTVPRDGLAPTSNWERGQVLIDRYGILLPQALPPGQYSLVVAVYHAVTGERLPAAVDGEAIGDHVLLGDVTVDAP